jgi:hypothetical protein
MVEQEFDKKATQLMKGKRKTSKNVTKAEYKLGKMQ